MALQVIARDNTISCERNTEGAGVLQQDIHSHSHLDSAIQGCAPPHSHVRKPSWHYQHSRLLYCPQAHAPQPLADAEYAQKQTQSHPL
jgi:hypothetical protein